MPFLIPLLAVTIWSGSAIVNVLSADLIAPQTIAFYRWFIAFLVLTPFLLRPVWRQRQAIKPYLTKLSFLAVLSMVLNQSLGYFAAATTTATNITLITALIPLISLLMSVPLLGIKLSTRAVLGVVISFSGLLYMLSQGQISNLLHGGVTDGDKYIFIAAICYSLYSVLLKRWKLPFNNWTSLYVQVAFAVMLLFPSMLVGGNMQLSMQALPLVLYAAIPTSIFATWLWMQSIDNIGTDKTAMFMNIMPLLTASMSILFLGEVLTVYQLTGGIMVVSGVVLTQLKRRKAPVELTSQTL